MDALSSIGIFLWFSETFFRRLLYGIILIIVFSACTLINEKRPDMEDVTYVTVGFIVAYLVTLFLKQSISYWILMAYAFLAFIYALYRKFAPISMKKVRKLTKRYLEHEAYQSLFAMVKVGNDEVNQIVFDGIADLNSIKAVEMLRDILFDDAISKSTKSRVIDISEGIIQDMVDSNAFEDVEYLLNPTDNKFSCCEWTLLTHIILDKHKDKAAELFLKYGSNTRTVIYDELKNILTRSRDDESIDILLAAIAGNAAPDGVAAGILDIVAGRNSEQVINALVRAIKTGPQSQDVGGIMLRIIKELRDRADMQALKPILDVLNENDSKEIADYDLKQREMQASDDDADEEWCYSTAYMFTYREEADGCLTVTGYTGEPKDIIIPEFYDGSTVTAIATGAFDSKDITSLILAPTIKIIGDEAFYGNHLTVVNIPDSVEIIGSDAFKHNNLNHVGLSRNLKKLGSEAFCRNNIFSVQAPQAIVIGNDKMKFMLMQAFDPGVKIDIR